MCIRDRSIFSGNWFDAEDGTAYQLPPELDLICTAHYLEALTMQAKASQISACLLYTSRCV